MKKNRVLYFTGVLIVVSSILTIYCSYNKNIGAAVINILSVCLNAWVLGSLFATNWASTIRTWADLRIENVKTAVLNNYVNQMKLHDLSNERLSNLEKKYNALAEHLKEKG